MKHDALLNHAGALLAAILSRASAADKAMERHFRDHRELGSRDRGEIAETVYACLRTLALLRYLGGEKAPASALVALHLLSQGWSARALEQAGYRERDEQFNVRSLTEKLRNLDAATVPLAVKANMPEWLVQRLVTQLGEEETLELAAALNRPATLDLRVNTLKADRETVQARLAAEGQALEPTPYSPLGLRRPDRAPLFKTAGFRAGLFEIQDEGSQLLGLLLEPKRREMVVDFCAGAGGKTLELGALMANSGTLYAFDIAAKRLENSSRVWHVPASTTSAPSSSPMSATSGCDAWRARPTASWWTPRAAAPARCAATPTSNGARSTSMPSLQPSAPSCKPQQPW